MHPRSDEVQIRRLQNAESHSQGQLLIRRVNTGNLGRILECPEFTETQSLLFLSSSF